MSGLFLGIDTSNYTTSAAVYGSGVEINGKKLLSVKAGEIGLRQSDAVFQHVRQLTEVYGKTIDELNSLGYTCSDVSAVGVSYAPRAVEGSYMPCFLVGRMLGECLAKTLNVPLYLFSHQQGHIAAALYSCRREDLLGGNFLAFHLSGGTTEGLYVTPDENGLPDAEIVASSLDLKAGQAVDRIGVMLGFPFPCGRYLDELSRKSRVSFRIKPSMKGADFSLSGVQNKCEQMLASGSAREDIAKFCLEYIAASLDFSLSALLEKYGDIPVLFSGGVSSNSLLRERLGKKYGALFAQPAFSCDNAFGTAYLASVRYGQDKSGKADL